MGAHAKPAAAPAGVDGDCDPARASADGGADVAGDLDELVQTAAQRDEYLALAQRTQADFENYRKRVAREAAGAQERGAIAARQGAAAGARQPRPRAGGGRRG